MAKAKKKTSGDAVGTQPARPQSASVREDPKQARRDLDDALRSHDSTRVAKAVSRCRAWIWLRETLENLLDDRNWIEGNKPYRVWIHPADAERYARESGDSSEKARSFLEWIEELSLRESLADAERRIVLLDQTLSDAIARTSRRIFEGVKNEIEDDFGVRHSEPTVWVVSDLGDAIKAVGMLLDADRKLAQPDSSEPQDPLTPEQSGYLKLLHEQDEGEAISDEIAAKRIGYSDPSSIVDLRKVLREKGWNAIATKTGRGGGSSLDRSLLTPVQRDRLDAL
jgi:hypothetical protein